MRTALLNSPTESRKFIFFSNFKNSRRVRWSEQRHFSY
jgi:hypothetical protein